MNFWGKRILTLLFVCFTALILLCLVVLESPLLPTCFFHEFTGLHCPGCGATRALRCLTNLDLAGAWSFNPLLLVGLPFFGVVMVVQGMGWFFNRPGWRITLSSRFAIVILIIVLLFWLLRNLPGFEVLAPGWIDFSGLFLPLG